MNKQLNYQRLLIVFLICIPVSVGAQNAYYDALKIDFINHKIEASSKEYVKDSIKLMTLIKSNSSIPIVSNTSLTEVLSSFKTNNPSEYNDSIVAIQKLNTKLMIQKNRILVIPDIENFKGFIQSPFNNINKENLDKIRELVITNKHGEFGIHPDYSEIFSEQSLLGGSSLISIPTKVQSANIDAISKFLADRFKEDITALYINKFRKKLDSIPELKALYPKTHSFLKSADVFNYRSLGNDFKEVFEEDLKNTLVNLGNYIEGNEDLKDVLKNKKVYYPFDFALSLSDKLVKGHHPVEILDFLEGKYKDDPDLGFKNYYNIVYGLNILQNNLQRKKSNELSTDFTLVKQFENIWLRFSDLKKLDSPKKIEYFMALIYNQNPTYFTDVLKINKENANDFFKNTIYPITELLNTIENIQSKEKSMTADDYVDVMTNSLNLLKLINKKEEEIYRLTDLSFKNANGTKVEIDVLDLIEKVNDLYKSIQTKDYGYIVTNSLYITEKVLLTSGESKANIVKVTQAMSKYGGFMVDIVTADDSDEVKEAIKKNVTKFSFLDKRNSLFSLTISAHPGVFGGFEELKENNESQVNLGITAPIGFEFMWGIRAKKDLKKKQYAFVKKKDTMITNQQGRKMPDEIEIVKYLSGHSWSIFVSFADLGAAFNYRLNDSESELPQELTFKQIFSPGISLNYGFRNSPLTLGAGIQYTPELRKVTVDDIETNSSSLRALLRLSWDIPLIKIYNKN